MQDEVEIQKAFSILKASEYEAFNALSSTQLRRALEFHQALIVANEGQNLTRLTSVSQFIEGHLIDCIELNAFLQSTSSKLILDLGSGCGVPGLLCALLWQGRPLEWTLCDSERSKVDFLREVSHQLGAGGVDCVWGRGEEVSMRVGPDCIVSRAVGSMTKVSRWVKNCSTWNKLVFLKGPKWKQEWDELRGQGFAKRFRLGEVRNYRQSPQKTVTLVEVVR